MKALNLFLIACICLVSQPLVLAQTKSVYRADLFTPIGKSVQVQPVEISIDGEALIIRGKKKTFKTKTISLTEIQNVDYTYSDKPRYAAAILSTVVLGIIALPVFASKTKKNWLTVSAGENSAVLQLQGDNYRMLLLELRGKGIQISDSGDRDEKDEKAEKQSTEKTN